MGVEHAGEAPQAGELRGGSVRRGLPWGVSGGSSRSTARNCLTAHASDRGTLNGTLGCMRIDGGPSESPVVMPWRQAEVLRGPSCSFRESGALKGTWGIMERFPRGHVCRLSRIRLSACQVRGRVLLTVGCVGDSVEGLTVAGSTGAATWAGDVPGPRGAACGKATMGRGLVAAIEDALPVVGGSAAGGDYAMPAGEEGC